MAKEKVVNMKNLWWISGLIGFFSVFVLNWLGNIFFSFQIVDSLWIIALFSGIPVGLAFTLGGYLLSKNRYVWSLIVYAVGPSIAKSIFFIISFPSMDFGA